MGGVAPAEEVGTAVPNDEQWGKGRKCRDVLCLLLFILFWVVWIFIAASAFTDGCPDDCVDPMSTFYQQDSTGIQCGKKSDTARASRKNLWVYNPVDFLNGRACTDVCPTEWFKVPCVVRHMAATGPDNSSAVGDTYTLQYKAPSAVTAFMGSGISLQSLISGVDAASFKCVGTPGGGGAPAVGSAQCCYPTVTYKSAAVLFFCIPDVTDLVAQCTNASNAENSETGGSASFINEQCAALTNSTVFQGVGGIGKFFGELNTYWYVVVAAALTGIFIGFFWLILLRLFAKCMVWITIWSMFLALAVTMLFFMDRAQMISLSSALTSVTTAASSASGANTSALEAQAQAALAEFNSASAMDPNVAKPIAIAFAVLAGLYFFIICFMMKRISIAVAVVQEAAKALAALGIAAVFFPLVGMAQMMVTMLWFVFVSLYLAALTQYDALTMTVTYRGSGSSMIGSIVNGTISQVANNATSTAASNYMSINDTTLVYVWIINGFGYLWATAFVRYFHYLTLSGAFAKWYFTRDKRNLGKFPILSSMKRVVFYHLGSVVFGALIIAIMQAIRYTFNYLMKKMGKAKDHAVIKVIWCCVNCCLKCIERFLDFINKNAFIMIAIHGWGFCKAALEAFKLLLRNALRVATITVISSFLLFLGRMFVTAATVMVAFGYFKACETGAGAAAAACVIPGTTTQVTFSIGTVVVCGIAGYVIALLFMGVFEVGIDTIFLSFCHDIEMNDGSKEKPYYMADGLKNIVGVKNKKVTPAP